MVFSSPIFLFCFLPAFLAAYYLTPSQLRSYTITIGSYLFYGWWRVDMLLLLILVTFWAWGCSLMIERAPGESSRRFWCGVGVSVGLITLFYFKYSNFFLETLNEVLRGIHRAPIPFEPILLPIGISFFTFQAISYVIDVYRRDVKAAPLITIAAYKALFPQLIAGPVLRYKDLDVQFRQRTHTFEKFGEGIVRFAQGFAMKVLIADTVAPIADATFAHGKPQLFDAWLGTLAYTTQIYFDFAGYSSMAIGLGLMIGFRFHENFNEPYASLSLSEFWRRWHISLSSWLRDYLYIPLGGNRRGMFNTYRNIWLTMLLGGLWHGANWTFLLWGVWHGSILVIERRVGEMSGRETILPGAFGSWLLTALFVIVGWVLFRATSVDAAVDVYSGMLGLNGGGLSETLSWQIRGLQVMAMMVAALIIALGVFRNRGHVTFPMIRFPAIRPLATISWGGILFVAIGKLVADGFSPFLYFQF